MVLKLLINCSNFIEFSIKRKYKLFLLHQINPLGYKQDRLN